MTSGGEGAGPEGVPGSGGAPPAGRGNGLAAPSYTPVAECDPWMSGELLTALAGAGVAAYVLPSPGTTGAYLEVRLPARPLDRVYVDTSRRELAEEVVAVELPDATLLPEDGTPVPPRPVLDPWELIDEEDLHYHAPPPPPLPRFSTGARVTALLLAAGVALLVIPGLVSTPDPTTLQGLGVLSFAGGLVLAILRLKNGGPGPDDPDDGAVV